MASNNADASFSFMFWLLFKIKMAGSVNDKERIK